MSTKKYQITQLQNDDSLLVLHPETDADIVSVTNGSGAYGGQATNVQDALEEVYALAENGGVTGVKGDAESSYRDGNVNITKTNIGLGNVTNDAQVKGLASGTTSGHIVKFGTDGYTIADAGAAISTTAPSSSSTDAQIPTSKAVNTAIASIPKPMRFAGTLGSVQSTISDLPTNPAEVNLGQVYLVAKDGTYAGNIPAQAGDLFVCAYRNSAYYWQLIPSGNDEDTDTWRQVKVNDTLILDYQDYYPINLKNGGHITASASVGNGNITLGVESGYSIPSTTDQASWTAKYDKASTGIPKTDLASAVQTSLGKADSALQENQTITLSGDVSGSGKTSIAVTLANSGVTAGTYSAVQVNAKGLVTNGGSIIEVGAANQTTPSSSLAVGGIFFKEV